MPQLHAADLPVPHTGQHLQTDPAPAAKKLSANIVANGNQKNNRPFTGKKNESFSQNDSGDFMIAQALVPDCRPALHQRIRRH